MSRFQLNTKLSSMLRLKNPFPTRCQFLMKFRFKFLLKSKLTFHTKYLFAKTSQFHTQSSLWKQLKSPSIFRSRSTCHMPLRWPCLLKCHILMRWWLTSQLRFQSRFRWKCTILWRSLFLMKSLFKCPSKFRTQWKCM